MKRLTPQQLYGILKPGHDFAYASTDVAAIVVWVATNMFLDEICEKCDEAPSCACDEACPHCDESPCECVCDGCEGEGCENCICNQCGGDGCHDCQPERPL